jgi:hypothetical protein
MSASFGKLKESLNASQYLSNKKNKVMFCLQSDHDPCLKHMPVACESSLLQYKKLQTEQAQPTNNVKTNNLYMNLITKFNLDGVEVMQPNNIVQGPPLSTYLIDPLGQLFGNSICGTNNYLQYVEYNPPPSKDT